MGPWVAPAIMGGASVIGSLLNKGKGGSDGAAILETPEQRKARELLLKFGMGDNTYKGKMGSYDMTGAEAEGQNQLMRVLGSTRPEAFGLGEGALKDLFGGTFDPYNDKGSFAGFKQGVMKERDEAVNRLKRTMTMGNNLYSTATIKKAGDIEGDVTRALTDKMGSLYENFTQNKINAIPTAFAAGQAQESLDLGRVGAAATYGSLPRMLENQEYRDAYDEFVRAQNAQVGALGQAAGSPGFTPTSSEGSDPWSRVMEMLAQAGGAGLGKYFATA